MPLNFFKKKKSQENKGTEEQDTIENKPPEIGTPTNKESLNTQVNKVVDIKAKEKEVRRKKRRFHFILTVLIISILIMILTPIGVRVYKKYFLKPEPIVQEPTEVEEEPKEEAPDPETIVEYKNDDLQISLDYLMKATLFENVENTELTKRIEVVYDKNNDNNNTRLDNLTEGYIFRVSTFITKFREIDEITQVKKDAFKAMCPETAEMTDTLGIDIDGTEGRTFEVYNCNADYKVSYVVKNGLNYEFAQIFKGDLGYRQFYKAETENIMRSVEFYPEIPPDLGPTEKYDSEILRLSFEYPRSLDAECCSITGPISASPKILLTIGDPETYVDDNNLDAIAFFADDNRVGDFNEYVEKQKNLLTDDYLVTMGQYPTPQVRSVKVGDRDGVMLRGYSWRGNDLIYVDITQTNQPNKVLVISIKNISGGSFEDVTDSILESFEFY
jgi:hypothetical protein